MARSGESPILSHVFLLISGREDLRNVDAEIETFVSESWREEVNSNTGNFYTKAYFSVSCLENLFVINAMEEGHDYSHDLMYWNPGAERLFLSLS